LPPQDPFTSPQVISTVVLVEDVVLVLVDVELEVEVLVVEVVEVLEVVEVAELLVVLDEELVDIELVLDDDVDELTELVVLGSLVEVVEHGNVLVLVSSNNPQKHEPGTQCGGPTAQSQ